VAIGATKGIRAAGTTNLGTSTFMAYLVVV